jgi:hypothetical protein
MKLLQAIALLAVSWVCVELALAVHELKPKAELTLEHINRATIAAGAAAGNVEKASRAWQKASEEQSKSVTLALGLGKETFASIQTLVRRTDASLNESVFPNLAASVSEQNQSLSNTQAALRENLLEISRATVQGEKLIEDADAQITDPAIQKTLDNVADSSANLASATKESAATIAKVREGVDYEVNQLMKPITKVKAAILFTAEIVGKFLGI